MIKVDISGFDSELLKLVEAIKSSQEKEHSQETLQRISNEFPWNAIGDHTKQNWERTDSTFKEYESERVEFWKKLVSDFAERFTPKKGLNTKCRDIQFISQD